MVSLDIIAEHDGLLLVHPDWYTHPSTSAYGIEKVYKNFKIAQEYCSDNDIPFMIAPAFLKYMALNSPMNGFDLSECHKIDNQNIVGHVSEIIRKSPEDIKLVENMENTSITIFETDKDGKLYMKLFNCAKHLD